MHSFLKMNTSKLVTWSFITTITIWIFLPVGSIRANDQAKKVFDVHLHFSYDQAGETTPQEAIEILRRQNVVYGVVSSTPPDMALDLKAIDPRRILALWRPYFDAGSRHNWFNDTRALPEARKALASGKYIGIGELHMISGLGATPKNTILNGLIRLGIEFDVPLLIHTETSSHKYFLPLCKRYPRARFLWAHAGGRLGPDEVRALLNQCKNVWVEFSARDHWRYVEDPIVDEQGRLLNGWLKLIKRYPDRFMIGADPVWPVENVHSWDQPDTGWQKYDDYLNFHRQWLAFIPENLADRIRYDNAYKFFFR
jgi:predicted TIM-barrel fold metal-dependent hydrolase